MKRIRRWWKQLWCAHYWIQYLSWQLTVDQRYDQYVCIKCDKRKHFKDLPISYIE